MRTVLAQWESGLPAIVSHPFGQGQVVFVGTGSGQVWQPRAGSEVRWNWPFASCIGWPAARRRWPPCRPCAEQLHHEETIARTAVRDRVLNSLEVAAPKDFVVVSRDNVGRFGWLIEEGGLVENMSANGRVAGLLRGPSASEPRNRLSTLEFSS